MEEKIRHLLTSVVHPETGQDIVGSGFIEHIASGAGKITVVLRFAKARDPFAVKIKNQAEEILRREFPQQNVMVVIKEGGAAPRPEPKLKTTTGGIAKVIAGVEMFRNENVNIPVAGVIENMAWFTPEELPENRYYIFGKGGARRYAEENGVDFLGEIPIVQSIMEGSDEGRPAAGIDPRVEKWYREIAEKTVEKVMKSC